MAGAADLWYQTQNSQNKFMLQHLEKTASEPEKGAPKCTTHGTQHIALRTQQQKQCVKAHSQKSEGESISKHL